MPRTRAYRNFTALPITRSMSATSPGQMRTDLGVCKRSGARPIHHPHHRRARKSKRSSPPKYAQIAMLGTSLAAVVHLAAQPAHHTSGGDPQIRSRAPTPGSASPCSHAKLTGITSRRRSRPTPRCPSPVRSVLFLFVGSGEGEAFWVCVYARLFLLRYCLSCSSLTRCNLGVRHIARLLITRKCQGF
jgi:hypothetical protein